MPVRRQTLATALLVLLAACSASTAPIETRATVVVPETVVPTHFSGSTSQWIQFNLPVTIRNTASVPLTFLYCGSGIEVQTAGGWTNIYSPICTLTNEARSPIAPGETRVVSVPIVAAVGGNGGPMWGDGSVNGTYRLKAALSPEGFSGTIPLIASNAFTLLP